MHRTRTGRRAHLARLPALGPILLAGAVLTACGGSGGSGGSSATSPPTSTPSAAATASVPSSPAAGSAAPTPVSAPLSSPTAIKRAVTRPPGAQKMVTGCDADAGVIQLFIENQVFANNGDRSVQLRQLAGLGQLIKQTKPDITKGRTTFLRNGYPATFPAVHDLDGYLAVFAKLQTASAKHDLDAVPTLYTELEKVTAQFVNDTPHSICPV